MAPFAEITQGPIHPTGANPSKQALVFDRQNNIVSSVGDSGQEAGLATALIVAGPQTALTTITTAQNLIQQALNAGVLNKLKRTVKVSGTVIFTVSAGTPTATIIIKLGAVTLCTIVTAALAASTNGQLQFEFVLVVSSTGATGTIEAHGTVIAQLSTNLATAVAQYLDQIVAASSAVDLTSALTLVVSITGSTTIASAQLRNALIRVVN